MKLKHLWIGIDGICYFIQVGSCIAVLRYLKRIHDSNSAMAEMIARIHDHLVSDEEEDFEEEND